MSDKKCERKITYMYLSPPSREMLRDLQNLHGIGYDIQHAGQIQLDFDFVQDELREAGILDD